MSNFMDADFFREVRARRDAIRKEEGLHDDNVETATANDLDAVAAGWGIYRASGEMDYELRSRVRAKIEASTRRL